MLHGFETCRVCLLARFKLEQAGAGILNVTRGSLHVNRLAKFQVVKMLRELASVRKFRLQGAVDLDDQVEVANIVIGSDRGIRANDCFSIDLDRSLFMPKHLLKMRRHYLS